MSLPRPCAQVRRTAVRRAGYSAWHKTNRAAGYEQSFLVEALLTDDLFGFPRQIFPP
jgi:hypothetical protein